MNKISKILLNLLCLLFLMVAPTPIFAVTVSEGSIIETTLPDDIKPDMQIGLPGLKFSKIEEEKIVSPDGKETTFKVVPYLGEYIMAVYNYVVLVASILATVVILFSGLSWVASGGNAEKIKQAQKRIGGAIAGLSLVAISYLFLYTINPELVQLRKLKVQFIEKIPFGEEYLNDPDAPLLSNPPGEVLNGIPLFKQCDKSWGHNPYGEEVGCYKIATKGPYKGKIAGHICSSGCGVTSFAMIVNYFGYTDVNPAIMAQYAVSVGARKQDSDGECFGTKGPTLCSAISKQWKTLNCRMGNASKEIEKIITNLRNKKPIVFSCHDCIGQTKDGKSVSYGAHFMVLTSVDDSGTIFSVNDPASKRGVGSMSFIGKAELTTHVPSIYFIEKK